MNTRIILATLLLSSSASMAGERVDQSLDAAPEGFVSIEHLNGHMVVKGWDKSEVSVVGELDERAKEFIFEQRGSDIIIEVVVPKGSWKNFSSEQGDNLKVFVPKRSKVKYHSINADAEFIEIKGGISAELVNGDIKAKELGHKIRLETVNGDINTEDLEGQIVLETVNGDIDDEDSRGRVIRYGSVNGDIEATSFAPRVSIDTVNGDIELNLDVIDELELNTVNGEVEANLILAERGEIEANSVGGRIELSFRKALSASFDIDAHAGGRIVNNITSEQQKKAKYGPSRWLNFKVGEGDARVSVSTVSGRVELNKAD